MHFPLAIFDTWVFAMIIVIIAFIGASSYAKKHDPSDPSSPDFPRCPRPGCDQSLPSQARFCSRCGIPVSQSRSRSPVPPRARRIHRHR